MNAKVIKEEKGNLEISKELFNVVEDILKTASDDRSFLNFVELRNGFLHATDGGRALKLDVKDEVGENEEPRYFQPAKIRKSFYLVEMNNNAKYPDVDKVIPKDTKVKTMTLKYEDTTRTAIEDAKVEWASMMIANAPIQKAFLKPLKYVGDFVIKHNEIENSPIVYSFDKGTYIVMPLRKEKLEGIFK